jgi:ribosomal protein L4
MQLHPTVFAQDISRTDLLHRSVVWQRSQWRKVQLCALIHTLPLHYLATIQGNAKVKGRAEVRGGGR